MRGSVTIATFAGRAMRVRYMSQISFYMDGFHIRTGGTASCVSVIDTSFISFPNAFGWSNADFTAFKPVVYEGCPSVFAPEESARLHIRQLDPIYQNGAGTTAIYNINNQPNVHVNVNGQLKVGSRQITASGSLASASPLQTITAVSPATVTLTNANIANMLNREYSVFSTTAAAHIVQTTGSTALFYPGGYTVATFPPSVGAGIKFQVVSATVISVTGLVGNVTFS